MSDQDLNAQVAQLRELYEGGLLSEANYRAALVGLGVDPGIVASGAKYHIHVEQGAGLAIGDGARVDRPEPGAGPEALRQAYLARMARQTRRLPLAGVDPKAASDE